jgi:glucose-6-phosphate dehydrogenase assembly protein OpcA
MEDAVSETLMESAPTVGFAQLESVLGRDSAKQSDAAPARALTATVVAVGPSDRLQDVVKPLQSLGNSGAIRGILIPQGSTAESGARVASNVVVLNGLPDNFIDNAVAALRLSSLPTVIWWRGGPTEVLANLIKLADRVLLDADPPEPAWKCAVERFDRAAFSDLRWTRLTRWRALMAQFFDLPEVEEAASSFNHLCIEGSDRASASLFGAWMKTELEWGDNVTIEIQGSEDSAPIASVSLTGGSRTLNLRLAKSRTCVESAAQVGQSGTSRVVSLGDESLTALLTEELRIRSRDRAFESALAGVLAS